jgi:hypothetical protein
MPNQLFKEKIKEKVNDGEPFTDCFNAYYVEKIIDITIDATLSEVEKKIDKLETTEKIYLYKNKKSLPIIELIKRTSVQQIIKSMKE